MALWKCIVFFVSLSIVSICVDGRELFWNVHRTVLAPDGFPRSVIVVVDEADVEPADPSPSDAAAVDWQELQKEAPFCDLCCEPRQDWHAVPLGAGPSSHDCIEQPPPSPTHSIGGGDRVVLRTFAHGRDEPLLTPVLASHQAVASVLRSTHAPGWLWTEADVSDLHLGVPSLTGSREERVGA